MLIGLDMDGVFTGWDEYLDQRIQEVPALDDFPRQPERGWNDFSKADPKHIEHVHKILDHPHFYRNLPPMPGAADAANKLRYDGHDVVFVTSPFTTNPMCFQAKADWLAEHVGLWAKKSVIITDDKTLVISDVLVDDKPVIKGRRFPSWHRIVFHQTYNAHIAGPRIMNWTDGSWEEVIREAEEALQ